MQELGPMSSLLKDCCKIAGFAYGEVWAREDVEIAKILSTGQRLEAADVMPRLAHHAEVEMSKMNDLSDVKVELASLADQPHHHSEEIHREEGLHGSSVNTEDGLTRRELRSTSLSRLPSNPFGSFVHNSNSVIHIDRLKWDENGLNNTLSFMNQYVIIHQLVKKSSGMRDLIIEYAESGSSRVYGYGEGFAGFVWQKKRSHTFNFFEAQSESIENDSRFFMARKLFSSCVGVPILDPHNPETVVAVMVLYRSKSHKGIKDFLDPNQNASLSSFLEHAASIAPTAIMLQMSLPAWHVTMQHCKLVEEEREFRRTTSAAGQATAQQEEAQPQPVIEHDPLARARDGLKFYMNKFKGQTGQAPLGSDWKYTSFSGIGSFICLLIIMWVDDTMKTRTYKDDSLFALVGSFGAVVALVFAAPQSPVSQPRAIFFGHIICCVVAIIVDYFTIPLHDKYAARVLLPIFPQWLATAIVPAIGITVMSATGYTHPPAAACATVYISDKGGIVKNLHWGFILFPVLFDCFVIIAVGVLFNNAIPSRQYPLLWRVSFRSLVAISMLSGLAYLVRL